MNDPAVARVEPTPNDWLARAAKYAAEPWWLIAAGYAAVLLAIVFSLAAVPVLSLARQTFAFLGILFGAWALWTRMRKPWQAEEPTQAYLWAFLVPLVLMCFVAI